MLLDRTLATAGRALASLRHVLGRAEPRAAAAPRRLFVTLLGLHPADCARLAPSLSSMASTADLLVLASAEAADELSAAGLSVQTLPRGLGAAGWPSAAVYADEIRRLADEAARGHGADARVDLGLDAEALAARDVATGVCVLRPDPVAVEHEDPAHALVQAVDWTLGGVCNYACSYCPPRLHDGRLRWHDGAAVRAAIDRIVDAAAARGRTVWFTFTGGEPTLNPDLPGILDHAHARGARAGIISNGSRTLRHWDTLLPRLDRLILTFHGEQADPAHFLAVAERAGRAVPTQVNVPMAPDRFDDLLAFARRLAGLDAPLTVILKPILVDFGTELVDYTDDQRAVLLAGLPVRRHHAGPVARSRLRLSLPDGSTEVVRASALVAAGRNRFAGYACAAGLESLRISAEGEVFRAVCREGGRIGHLDDFDPPSDGVVCGRARCSCIADVLITKRRKEMRP